MSHPPADFYQLRHPSRAKWLPVYRGSELVGWQPAHAQPPDARGDFTAKWHKTRRDKEKS